MIKIQTLLTITVLLFGISDTTYAEKFHCRITDVKDYDTKNVINSSPNMTEFITETDTETNIYYAGNVNGISGYEGSMVANTDKHTPPFIVISKLDNKFFGMYLYRPEYHNAIKSQGFLVSGFCKEIDSIF